MPKYPSVGSRCGLVDPYSTFERLVNVDWGFHEEETLYLAHDVHPYPAKFIPQIPGHLISLLTLPGELVLDPFGGCGTTALEAVRLGRRAISIDVNPIGALIGRVKTARPGSDAWKDLRSLRACVAAFQRQGKLTPDDLLAHNAEFVPSIPNVDKWFPVTSRGELAWLCRQISEIEDDSARDIGQLALSRVVLGASFQESETRYASNPREIPAGATLQAYILSLDTVLDRVWRTSQVIGRRSARFITGDSRAILELGVEPDSVDLVVTSPPYGNAMDYHLYHRFRLFWTGHDPRSLGRVEIGSHLRHQREGTGFTDFMAELKPVLDQAYAALRPGRYAAFVIGSSIYCGKRFDGASALADSARDGSWELVGLISRSLPKNRRSFKAGRRATDEQLVILRKPPRPVTLTLAPPRYRPWPYENELRYRETEAILGPSAKADADGTLRVTVDAMAINDSAKLAFSSRVQLDTGSSFQTWQNILENGGVTNCVRKEPKYVTHGLHAYKGKFYPQLAKALLNLAKPKTGGRLLDPFCGSGTALLEGRLNGWRAFGIDMNPLAAKIARAKLGILDVDPRLVNDVFDAVDGQMSRRSTIAEDLSSFAPHTHDEILSWFPLPVAHKLNWLLKVVRTSSAGVVREYLEVIVSDLLREVSHQDLKDLRIRRRKRPLQDADVLGRFRASLNRHRARLDEWWANHGYCPTRDFEATVLEQDSRAWEAFEALGLEAESVDAVVTSPPYATALPYIDTDRLSLLVLFGLDASRRRPIEHDLTGSREIRTAVRRSLEEELESGALDLPEDIARFISKLHADNRRAGVGFRRRNLAALLVRFFRDIGVVLKNCHRAMRNGAECFIIIGDNTTRVGSRTRRIPTGEFTRQTAERAGLTTIEEIPISVTTEDLKHAKHAIKENAIIRLQRSSSHFA